LQRAGSKREKERLRGSGEPGVREKEYHEREVASLLFHSQPSMASSTQGRSM